MSRFKFKNYTAVVTFALLAAVLWSYFQPAFQFQFSGIPAKHWSAHELAQDFYKGALKALQPKKQSNVKVEIDPGFVDYLKKLFPQKKHEPNWKAYAGLILGALIPISFLLAYLSLLLGGASVWIPALKRRRVFFTSALFLSLYALAGILFLREKADDLVEASLQEASRGIFGFITKSFVQQIHIEPGIALISLPCLAAALWLVMFFRKK